MSQFTTPAILEMLGHYHFLNNAAYLFLLMLAGVSVDRRQCHHRFYPNISIGENPVNPPGQFAQNDIFCTGQTIKIPFAINEFYELISDVRMAESNVCPMM